MTDFVDLLEEQLVAAHRRRGRSRVVGLPSRRAGAALGAGLAAAAAVFAAVVGLAGPDGGRRAQRAATAAPDRAVTGTVPVAPTGDDIVVAVLNATAVRGAGRAAWERIVRSGYKPGVVTNAPRRRQRSVVLFAGGTRNALAAVAIARREGIGRVAPLGADLRTVVGRGADVVVVVGGDRVRSHP